MTVAYSVRSTSVPTVTAARWRRGRLPAGRAGSRRVGRRATRPQARPRADDGAARAGWTRCPPDRDVVVVCRVGARSAQVVAYLLQQGWDRVRQPGRRHVGLAGGRPAGGQRRRRPAMCCTTDRAAGLRPSGGLRRAARTHPEAYLLAIAQGVDGLECDVRLTRDGQLVCVHDATRRPHQQRSRRGSVAAPWTSCTGSSTRRGRAAVGAPACLTLDELLTRTALPPAGRCGCWWRPSTRPGTAASVEERLVELLRRYGLTDPGRGAGPGVGDRDVVLAAGACGGCAALAPELPMVFLFELVPPRGPRGPAAVRGRIARPRARPRCGPGPSIVQRAHERGAPGVRVDGERAAGHRPGARRSGWTASSPTGRPYVLEPTRPGTG